MRDNPEWKEFPEKEKTLAEELNSKFPRSGFPTFVGWIVAACKLGQIDFSQSHRLHRELQNTTHSQLAWTQLESLWVAFSIYEYPTHMNEISVAIRLLQDNLKNEAVDLLTGGVYLKHTESDGHDEAIRYFPLAQA